MARSLQAGGKSTHKEQEYRPLGAGVESSHIKQEYSGCWRTKQPHKTGYWTLVVKGQSSQREQEHWTQVVGG